VTQSVDLKLVRSFFFVPAFFFNLNKEKKRLSVGCSNDGAYLLPISDRSPQSLIRKKLVSATFQCISSLNNGENNINGTFVCKNKLYNQFLVCAFSNS